MTFLLGMHAILWQEPPIHLRSTSAVRWPSSARVHATILPPVPPPKTMFVKRSVSGMMSPPRDVKFSLDVYGHSIRFKRSDLAQPAKMPLVPAEVSSQEHINEISRY